MKTIIAIAAATALALSIPSAGSAIADDVPSTVTDASLTWSMNGEIQGRPFFGDSNYLSAGISDGTQASYAATDKDVSILQRSAAGITGPATWDSRAAHVGAGGQAAQLVSLSGGDVTVAEDGAIDIRWAGAWTVNMYGGIAPFTLSSPHLVIDAAGTGTLRADLSGYSGVPGSTAPATPVAPAADVAVATFSGVTIETTRGFAVTPDFAGVAVTVPAGSTPQNTSVAGWGAWPQPFVDFQQATGLGSYWYTSGTPSTDPLKAPTAFSVGFGSVPAPVITTTPVPVVAPTPVATTPTAAPSVKPTTSGRLVWGVKASFRSYVTGSIAKGAITVSGGARSTRGLVVFGQDSGSTFTAEKGTGTSRYTGSVRFTGHAGILDLTLSDPVVRVQSKTSGILSVTVGGSRVVIGTVTMSTKERSERKGAVTYTNAPVTLTAAGASVFSYDGTIFYPAGTAMDPVTFTIGKRSTAASAASTVGAYTTWTAPATPPATTGATVDGPTTAGGRVTLTADGFAAGETGIHAVLYSSPVVLEDDLTADASGRVNTTVTLPTTLSGVHTLTLQGSVDRGVAITVAAPAAATGCTVDGASLTWGFKESFRSYISGTIAKGKWTTSGNASYTTPSFSFAAGTGNWDTEGDTATIAFTGAIRFTGHDGALDLTMSNPVLRMLDAHTAELLADVTSKSLDGAPDIDQKAVRFITLTLDDSAAASGTITAAPAVLTSEGAAAFAGFYPAGEAFDPVSLTAALPQGCAAAVVAPATPTATPATPVTPAAIAPTTATSATFPYWTAIVIGVLVLALLAALAVIVRLRRRLVR